MDKTLLVLVGPTGVGKTELSLQLAERYHTCIVSADSRQLYADLKIGTAAPTPAQQARVEHHLVGTLQLTDYYSAARYEEEVIQLLENHLFGQHDVVLLTGGSMMYVDAVCKGIDETANVRCCFIESHGWNLGVFVGLVVIRHYRQAHLE